MYVRTKEGLGQDLESWSAPHTLNRAVRLVPIGYFGKWDSLRQNPVKPVLRWNTFNRAVTNSPL